MRIRTVGHEIEDADSIKVKNRREDDEGREKGRRTVGKEGEAWTSDERECDAVAELNDIKRIDVGKDRLPVGEEDEKQREVQMQMQMHSGERGHQARQFAGA